MASGEQHSPSKGQKISTSSSSSRNESNETQWKLLPNNLELSTRSKPSKKQRNKEKLRSFPPEVSSSSSNVAENFSFNPSTFFNCPRAKCNTASWLKDQMVNDEKSKRRAFESDEVFSDSDLSLPHRMNMNFPVSQPFHVAEQHQGFQRPPSRNVVENENTKSTKDEFKKNEADSAIIFERLSHLQDFMSEATTLCEELDDPAVREQFSKLNEAVKHVADEEREKDVLLSQLVPDNGCYAAAGVSPSSSTSKTSKGKVAQRVTNGSELYGEEEHANKCNHLLEKMKRSEEKLMALKLQESLLHHMRKKAEKFSGAHGRESLETEDSTFDPLKQSIQDEIVVNGGSHWSADMVSEQRQPLQSSSSDKIEQSFSWKDEPQDMKQLHISLEHIKKRVQSMQQISECKNMTDSVSSDDCDDVTDVGQRVAAVELERKKLKNKLIELQEKKKMNDELLKELCYLKDTVSANAVKNGESFLPPSRSSQLQQSKDKREKVGHSGLDADRKLMKLQATLQQLEEMMNALSSEARSQDTNLESSDVSSCRLDSRRGRSVTSVKRDNVRKEQNSGFPARRHYEAEGRANEDADVPAAQAPVLPLGLDKLRDHPEIQDKIDKIRKLHMAQQQVKVINDIMASIQEAKKSGRSIPVEYLHLLSSIEKRDEKNELDESELDTDSEIDEACSNVVPEGSISEDIRTNAKEMCAEMRKNVENDNENHEHNPDVSADPDDTGIVNSQQNPLAKLQSHFHQLMQMFPVQEQRKDDPVRSSGEGEYSQNRNSSINIPIASRLTAPPIMRQDNIHLTRNASSSMSVASECLTSTPPGGLQDNLQLTRQNIASMESQNQNASANFHHKSCSSLKKDNINNLSGKKGKFCLQKSMAGSYVEMRREPKDNLDSLSTYSTDVSQNRATSNENERKTILDILKSDKKKQKMYDRNKGNQICSNSSIDSEPLEGSNSALAADTTIAATWGGSSTQENFEDENDDQVESLEEQEEDEDSMEVPVLEKKGSVCGRRKVAQFPQQFMQQSIDSVSDNSDKTENFHKKTFIRDPQIFHGYPPPPPPKARPRKMASFSGGVAGSSREISSSASCSDAISKDNQQHLSSGFVQQLKSHIEQLSALCQAQFLNDKPQVTKSYHQNSSQSIPNMCQPVQAISDMSQPCNQQLLLCLSQCYHALYMQQLEIQHLQRCIRHSMDSEVAHQTNNLNSHSGSSEDMAFRPWCMSTWSNPLLPSNLYLGDQASPLSPASYLQLPVKPHTPLNSNVSGTRPVRAVIHPASQDNRAAQETLNNQVPPRTRANNFWDNFRSYSRQNLLSTTTNMKRNENVGLPVAPQIRQVRPMVPNESTNRTLEMPNTYCSTSASSQLYRPSHNPELQVILSRSKKPNAAAMGCAVSCSASDLQKRAVSSNLNTSSVRNPRSNRYHMQNTESSSKPPVTYGNSVNLIQLHPSQDDSKVGTSSICPTSAETLVHTASENLNSCNSDQQSDFLIGLYEEAKALKSDAHRQRALNLIRDLVISERNDPDSINQNKIRNDQSAMSNKSETNTNAVSVQTMDNSFVEASNYLTEPNEAEKPLMRVSSESNVPWSSQNLPTAAIPPLSKHATSQSASTGAIRKKSKHQSATFEDTLTSTHACSYESLESDSGWENVEHTSVISNSRLPCDFPGTVVENILVDLQSALPFGQLCLLEDSASFWAAVTSYIIYRIRVHINIPLSQKALTSLRQALDHALARFTGANFCDCEADFLKCIAEFLYESLSCFVSTGRFTSNSIYSSAPHDETSSLDVDDKIPELTVKLPMDADDKTHELCISMPTEENDVYSSQFRSVLLQNVINGAGAEGNSNPQVNVQPNGAVGSEDDARCECHPEAETEPEVEAGTEADLAEADQSPGQQGAVGVSASIPLTANDNWSLDQAAVVLGRNVNISNVAVVSNNEDVSGISDDASEILLGAQFCSETCVDPVIIFDDIPTKLSPGSEEEPQRQPKEETVNLGRSDDANEIGEFSAENNCENEQNSLK